MVTPQVPAVMRDVSMIQKSAYQYPYMPAFRTSADGRVALSIKELNGGSLQFYLFAPEVFNSTNGSQVIPFALSAGFPTPTP